MENEDEHFLLLSGIQHFQFCKRQWALIHIEQQWEENVRTVEGQYIHRNADKPFAREKRGDKIIVRAMPVKSNELEVTGICDVVEFVKVDQHGVSIQGMEGQYTVYPVEYKRGKPKLDKSDELQLTAQAMCLEEMLFCRIDSGFLYYHEINHRVEIPLTDVLRQNVRSIVTEMRDYYRRRHTPKVKTGAFCRNCSLQSICLPALMSKRSVRSYIEGKVKE